MEKKLLLAVDDSIHSRHAIRYVARISAVIKDLTYTLFHVQPIISQFLMDEARTDFKAKCQLKKVIQKNAECAYCMLKEYKAQMIRLGIADQCIDVATRPRLLGVAKDVLDHAQQGLYDAIVVGRRGLSRVQKTFMGSTTAQLVEHSRVIPVWVVDGNVTSTNIMMALDGSENSLRAVDHLCYLVGQNPKIRVTLFHVMPRLVDYCAVDFDDKEDTIQKLIKQGNRRCVEHFYAHAQKKFEEAGLQEKQLDIKVTKRTVNVTKAILDEVKKGDYGTVVLGRRGTSKAFYMGSVSRHILDKISNRTVWLVS